MIHFSSLLQNISYLVCAKLCISALRIPEDSFEMENFSVFSKSHGSHSQNPVFVTQRWHSMWCPCTQITTLWYRTRPATRTSNMFLMFGNLDFSTLLCSPLKAQRDKGLQHGVWICIFPHVCHRLLQVAIGYHALVIWGDF